MSMYSDDLKAKLLELKALTKAAQQITIERFAHDKAKEEEETQRTVAERLAQQERDSREWQLVHNVGNPVVDGNTQTDVLVAWNNFSVTATAAAHTASSLASTAATAVSSAVQQAAATGQVVAAKLTDAVKKFAANS